MYMSPVISRWSCWLLGMLHQSNWKAKDLFHPLYWDLHEMQNKQPHRLAYLNRWGRCNTTHQSCCSDDCGHTRLGPYVAAK